ncbi:MAG TPA: hypothetical protein VGL44_09615 [Gaiellales bacterium]
MEHLPCRARLRHCDYFRREVWAPALTAAGLEQRAPYNLRHRYALHNLQSGVPWPSTVVAAAPNRHRPGGG